MSFRSLYAHGFARVAACTVVSSAANPAANARAILAEARLVSDQGAVLAVFPELCVSGYAIDDLLMQDVVLDAVHLALAEIVEGSRDLLPILLVGAPLRFGERLYNTAVVIHRGRILGVVPKIHIPNYREFYEKRHFASGAGTGGGSIRLNGAEVPFGPDLIFHAETCRASFCMWKSARTFGCPRRRAAPPRWRGRRSLPTCQRATSRSARRILGRCCPSRNRRGAR